SKTTIHICANTSQAADSAEGEGEARLLHKLDLLTSLVQDMVPVVKTLQESHDALLLQDGEVTGPAISEKIANVLNNILASGLNDQATKRRKENIHRPTNSTLLAQTRVNSEIWDIAKKPTRSMDARLQALQDTLIKGLIPLADMTGKVGRNLPELILPAFPADGRVCVYSVLSEYIKCTAPLRGGETRLFISFVKPYQAVSRDTISRWIKNVMIKAGIDVEVFKPHSTRAASTSKANACQVPIDVILKAASWKGDCTFRKFYNKPI
ncbi:unnamed protein product, partial [Porites lobata]